MDTLNQKFCTNDEERSSLKDFLSTVSPLSGYRSDEFGWFQADLEQAYIDTLSCSKLHNLQDEIWIRNTPCSNKISRFLVGDTWQTQDSWLTIFMADEQWKTIISNRSKEAISECSSEEFWKMEEFFLNQNLEFEINLLIGHYTPNRLQELGNSKIMEIINSYPHLPAKQKLKDFLSKLMNEKEYYQTSRWTSLFNWLDIFE